MIKRMFFRILAMVAVVAAGSAGMHAQSLFDEIILDGETVSASSDTTTVVLTDSVVSPELTISPARQTPRGKRPAKVKIPSLWDLTDEYGNPLDSLDFGPQDLLVDPYMDVEQMLMPKAFYLPAIFVSYDGTLAGQAINPISPDNPAPKDMNWAERTVARDALQRLRFQEFMIAYPELVRYNLETMPRAPKEFVMEVDPTTAKINVTEFTRDVKEMASVAKPLNMKRINWLHNFDGSLQFSQAYISPNWYQGGKSNYNGILNLFYKIRLNPAFHPNMNFETSIQYRLGVNNAPDDEVHDYNITEDLLQINTNFGFRAWKRWSYSVNAQFKTQLLNHYRFNSHDLTSNFMSPGELNVGVGMTYNIENRKKTVTFSAAINPLSYNLKICRDDEKLNPTWFGIEEGHKTKSQYGSNIELRFYAKLAWNIEYNSRLFAFTNYETEYGDWEHRITFNINRFLSTNIFAHLRYQSDAKPIEDTKWHKWQFKEILSIGFTYRFSRG